MRRATMAARPRRPTVAEIEAEIGRLGELHAAFVDLACHDYPLDLTLYPEIREINAAMCALAWARREPGCDPPSQLIEAPLMASQVAR